MIRGTEDTVVFKIGFLKVYKEGLSIAAFMAIKINIY